MLDRITWLEPGVGATAVLTVTAQNGPLPPVLLIESIAQLGGIAAGQSAGAGGVLAAVTQGLLPITVPEGHHVVSARIIKSFGALHMVAGEVHAAGAMIASATVTLAVADP